VRAGLSKAEIKEELLAVGWSEEEADEAYRDGLVALGIPLPSEGNRPTLAKKSSTVDVVVNFFSFIILGIVATALGTLYFQVINESFPDPLAAMARGGEWYTTRAIHHAIASLIIAFPLYYAAMRIWFSKFRDDEGRTESRLSKWLTYLVLLVAAVTIVGDLIAVLFKLLQGEISARFLLKALTIFVIAGIIFGFYFLERKKIQYRKDIPRATFQYFGWTVTAIVVIGIFLGFWAAGSPDTARKRAFDIERARNLGELSRCIERYAQDLGQLPAALDQLRKSSRYAACANSMRDPETRRQYEYRIVTPSRVEGPARVGEFELCATFSLASMGPDEEMGSYDNRYAIWNEHDVGRSCDTVTVQLVGKQAPATSAK
jgi:hypothetical protein